MLSPKATSSAKSTAPAILFQFKGVHGAERSCETSAKVETGRRRSIAGSGQEVSLLPEAIKPYKRRLLRPFATDPPYSRPPMNPIVIIPARLAATRLPNKPLADIGGRPMIALVVERALAAGLGPVAVAADSAEIAVGAGRLRRGRDRHARRPSVRLGPHLRGARHARPRRAPRRRRQPAGRLPDHLALCDRRRARPAGRCRPWISRTLAGEIVDEHERTNPNVVKVVGTPVAPRTGCARSISPARPRPGARGRSTTTAASTPIGARRWSVSSRCRRACLKCARSWSS